MFREIGAQITDIHAPQRGIFDDPVNLGGATLDLTQGWSDADGDCTTLKPGDSFPVISSGYTLSGDLTYYDDSGNLETLSPGDTSQLVPVAPPSGCSTGDPTTNASAFLNYLPETIMAKIGMRFAYIPRYFYHIGCHWIV